MAVIDTAGLCLRAGLPAPGTKPGFVERRQIGRGCRVVHSEAPGALGRWQRGAFLLVEESRRRRERTPWGDRWPTRRARCLVIDEPRRLGPGGASGFIHRHPVPRTVATVREAVAWMLRITPEDVDRIARAQGDVYVLRLSRLRPDALPDGHAEADGRLVHAAHLPIRAAGAGERYRVCRRAAESAYAVGGSAD